MGGEYTVHGTVTTPVGPASGVVVEAVDADIGQDDSLATTSTDDDGRYELRIDPDDAGGFLEGDPELYLRVSDSGRTTRVEVPDPSGGDVVEVDIELGPGGAGDRTGRSVADGAGTRSQLSPTSSGGTSARRPRHGMMEHRGMENVPRDPAHPGQGRFGRMFPNLAPAEHNPDFLEAVGLPGNALEEAPDSPASDADTVPAGFVFLGQFIDHDITLDPLSSLSKQADPDALRNFRTARLDLDSLYGAGPEAQPFLYRQDDSEKFLLGENDAGEHADLPRNVEGTALIGDMRNDENLVLSQLQHAMLRFHNRVVDYLRESPDDEVFEEAQQLVRWHYQWIVLHEYLPTVCQGPVVEATLDERELFTVDTGEQAYMPVEFAGAVYRFGHSQARFEYEINDEFGTGKLFGPPGDDDALSSGFEPVPSEKVVDWRHFFEFDTGEPQPAREIDPKLAPDLLELPFIGSDDHKPWERSLASRNLVRGRRLGLPSGPAVARRLGEEPLSNADSGFDELLDGHDSPGDHEPPLWYYTLAEASETTGGETLGPVGSRIVAEVLVGLVDADPLSFRSIQPDWTPTLPAPVSGGGTDYRMADLLAFALGYDE